MSESKRTTPRPRRWRPGQPLPKGHEVVFPNPYAHLTAYEEFVARGLLPHPETTDPEIRRLEGIAGTKEWCAKMARETAF